MKTQKEKRIKELRSQNYGTLQRTKEFKDFLNNYIYSESKNMNSEVSYILNKSFEDSETPFNWDDITNLSYFDIEELQTDILNIISSLNDEDKEECLKEISEQFMFNNEKDSYDKFILTSEEDDLKELIKDISYLNHLDEEDYNRENEILSWYMMDSRIISELEERDEPTLEGTYWGRCTFGQAIELDGVIIEIFKEWYLNLHGVDLYNEDGEVLK